MRRRRSVTIRCRSARKARSFPRPLRMAPRRSACAGSRKGFDSGQSSACDTFGATGYNGAASGWEVNFCYSSDDRAGLYAVAIGQNRDQQGNAAGATMLWIDCGDGGWTFATNSIAFNGSLPHDPACSVILANVLKQAIRG